MKKTFIFIFAFIFGTISFGFSNVIMANSCTELDFANGQERMVIVESTIFTDDGVVCLDGGNATPVDVDSIRINSNDEEDFFTLDQEDLSSYISDQVINHRGFYYVDYKVGSNYITRQFRILNPNLANENNNISDASMIWPSEISNFKNEQSSEENNILVDYASFGDTIEDLLVVGNKGSKGYVARINDEFGDIIWSDTYEFPNADKTSITFVERWGNSYDYIIGGYYETEGLSKPFVATFGGVNSLSDDDIDNESCILSNMATSDHEEGFVNSIAVKEKNGDFFAVVVGELINIADTTSDIFIINYNVTGRSLDLTYSNAKEAGLVGEDKDEGIYYYYESDDLNYIQSNSVEGTIQANEYLPSYRIILGGGEESLHSIKKHQEGFVVVGYTSSSNGDFSDNNLSASEMPGLIGFFDLNLFEQNKNIFDYYLYLSRFGDNVFATRFFDVTYFDGDLVVVGQTNFNNDSMPLAGQRDGLVVFVNSENMNKENAFTIGTSDNRDLLRNVSSTSSNNIEEKNKFVAVGDLGKDGMILEFDKSGIINQRQITSTSEGQTQIYGIKAENYDLHSNENQSYFIIGGHENSTDVEGIYKPNLGEKDFFAFIYEKGGFASFQDLAIEENFGIPKEQEIIEINNSEDFFEQISDAGRLFYDGKLYDFSDNAINAVDFQNKGTFTIDYRFTNKRGIQYIVPRTIVIIELRDAPELGEELDEIGISTFYTYRRSKPNYDNQVGREFSTISHHHSRAYLYNQGENIKTNFDFNQDTNEVIETLYHRNEAGEYIQISNNNNLKQAMFARHTKLEGEFEGIMPQTCYEIDFFGDYVQEECIDFYGDDSIINIDGDYYKEFEVEEDTIFVKLERQYYIFDYRGILEGNSSSKLVYEKDEIFYDVYTKRNIVEERAANGGIEIVDLSEVSKSPIIRSASFQTLETAKSYALYQELIRVNSYDVSELESVLENSTYYGGGKHNVPQATLLEGMSPGDTFYVYYIDVGDPSAVSFSGCGIDPKASCANYHGFVFANIEEIEYVAKQIVDGSFMHFQSTSSSDHGRFINYYNDRDYNLDAQNSVSQKRAANLDFQQELETPLYTNDQSIEVSENRVLRVWYDMSIEEVKDLKEQGEALDHATTMYENTVFGEDGDFNTQGKYVVQYCYEPSNCGEKREFYLDYIGPRVFYRYDNISGLGDIEFRNREGEEKGDTKRGNLFISNFEALDKYSYFEYQGERIRLFCQEDSKKCSNIFNESILNKIFTPIKTDGQGGVIDESTYYVLDFFDRAGNKTKIRFSIGGDNPSLNITETTNDGDGAIESFDIVMELFEKNRARNINVFFRPEGSQSGDESEFLSITLSSLFNSLKDDYYDELQLYFDYIEELEEDSEEENGEEENGEEENGEEENGEEENGEEEVHKPSQPLVNFSLGEIVEGTEGNGAFEVESGLFRFEISDDYGNAMSIEQAIGLPIARIYYMDRETQNNEEKENTDISKYLSKVGEIDFSLIGKKRESDQIYYVKTNKGEFVEYGKSYVDEDHFVFDGENYNSIDDSKINHAKEKEELYYLKIGENEFIKDDLKYIQEEFYVLGHYNYDENKVGSQFEYIENQNYVEMDVSTIEDLDIENGEEENDDESVESSLSSNVIGDVPSYLSKEDVLVNFMLLDDISFRVGKPDLVNDFGFQVNESVNECLFEIAGKNYDTDDSLCPNNRIFTFLYTDDSDEYDALKNEYNNGENSNLSNHYIVYFSNGTMEFEGVGKEEGKEKYEIFKFFDQIGVTLLDLAREEIRVGKASRENVLFVRLLFQEEGNYNTRFESYFNAITPISKTFKINQTPPKATEEFNNPEFNQVDERFIGTRVNPNERYYIFDGEEYHLDDFYFVSNNSYIARYEMAQQYVEGETYYTKSGSIYIEDEGIDEIEDGKHYIKEYDSIADLEGELKDINKTYYLYENDEFNKDNSLRDSQITSSHYVRERILREDTTFSWDENRRDLSIMTNVEQIDSQTGSYTMSTQGENKITFKDFFGFTNSFSRNIDKQAPIIEIVHIEDSKGQEINFDDLESTYRQGYEIILEIRDVNLNQITYSYSSQDGGSFSYSDGPFFESFENCDMVGEFTCQLTIDLDSFDKDNEFSGYIDLDVFANDFSGNSSSKTYTFNYDNNAPLIWHDKDYDLPSDFGNHLTQSELDELLLIEGGDFSYKTNWDGSEIDDETSILYQIWAENYPFTSGANVSVNAYEGKRIADENVFWRSGNDYQQEEIGKEINWTVNPESYYAFVEVSEFQRVENHHYEKVYYSSHSDPIDFGNEEEFEKYNYYYNDQENGEGDYILIDSDDLDSLPTYVKNDDDSKYENIFDSQFKKASDAGEFRDETKTYYIKEETYGEYIDPLVLESSYLFEEISDYDAEIQYFQLKQGTAIQSRDEMKKVDILDQQGFDEICEGENVCYQKIDVSENIGQPTEKDKMYYFEVSKEVSGDFVTVYVEDTRRFQKSSEKFWFNRPFVNGRPIVFSAQDGAGNEMKHTIDNIVRIIDSKKPKVEFQTENENYLVEEEVDGEEKLKGIISGGDVNAIFDKEINKYFCYQINIDDISKVDLDNLDMDDYVEICSETNYELFDSEDHFTSKQEQITYILTSPDNFIKDEGEKILNVHFVYDEEQETFKQVDSELIGENRDDDTEYFVFKEKSEKTQFYKEEGSLNYNVFQGDYLNYEFCDEKEGCYYLEFDEINSLEGINHFYEKNDNSEYIYRENDEDISNDHCETKDCFILNENLKEKIVLNKNDTYCITNQNEYGICRYDDGNTILPIHHEKINATNYEFIDREFDFNFEMQQEKNVYIFKAQDFSGNFSDYYFVYMDDVAPSIEHIGENSFGEREIVNLEAYQDNYSETDYEREREVSESNLDKLASVYEGVKVDYEILIDYFYYEGDMDSFNIDQVNEEDFNNYWASNNWETDWVKLSSDEEIPRTNEMGFYIVLYRVSDQLGNKSNYNFENSRFIIVEDTIDPKIDIEKYEIIDGELVYSDLNNCEGDNCVLSLLDPIGGNRNFIVSIDFDQHGDNEIGTLKDNDGETHTLSSKITYGETDKKINYYIDDDSLDANGEYVVEVSDGGYFVKKGKYVGLTSTDHSGGPNFTGFHAYQVAVFKDEPQECISGEDINIDGEKKCLEFIDDFDEKLPHLKYYVVKEFYDNGELVEKEIIYDDGTIVLPGHRLEGGSEGEEISFGDVGEVKASSQNYYFHDGESLFEDKISEYSLLRVRNSSNFTFTIDNKRPIYHFNKAQDFQKPYYMVANINDKDSILYVSKDGGETYQQISLNGEVLLKGMEIEDNIDGSWDVYFFEDGDYKVYVKDLAGNHGCFESCNDPTALEFRNFEIDNTPPTINYEEFSEEALGINHWYATPVDVFGASGMSGIFDNMPSSLSSHESYHNLENDDFNSSGYYAFPTYYDALSFIFDLYYENHSDVSEENPGHFYNPTTEEELTFTDFDSIINLLPELVFPTFSEEVIFGHESVGHITYSEEYELSMHDYLTCNIQGCFGEKLPIKTYKVDRDQKTEIFFNVSESDDLQLFTQNTYNSSVNGGNNINFSQDDEVISIDRAAGTYIIRERDNAKKFDGSSSPNEAWYAFRVVDRLSNSSIRAEFISEYDEYVEDKRNYVLPEHNIYEFETVESDDVENYAGIFIEYFDEQAGTRTYLPYDKNLIMKNHYTRDFIEIENNSGIDLERTYYIPKSFKEDSQSQEKTKNNYIWDGDNHIRVEDGLEKDSEETYFIVESFKEDSEIESKPLTFNHYYFEDEYSIVDENEVLEERNNMSKYYFETYDSNLRKMVFIEDDAHVESSDFWIDNFFYGRRRVSVDDSLVGTLRDENEEYYIFDGQDWVLDDKENLENSIISQAHYIYQDGGYIKPDFEEGDLKEEGVTYYLSVTKEDVFSQQHTGNDGATSSARNNVLGELKLPMDLVDRSSLDPSTGSIELYSYSIVKYRKASEIDWSSNDPVFENDGEYNYVLASDFFKFKENETRFNPKKLDFNYYYEIIISDRIGHEIYFNISMSDELPEIEISDTNYGYRKQIRVENSPLTSSRPSTAGEKSIYLEFNRNEPNNYKGSSDHPHVGHYRDLLNSSYNNGIKSIELTDSTNDFGEVTAKGYYRIRVEDNHGNLGDWLEFAFNPVVVEGQIVVERSSVNDPINVKRLTNQDIFFKWDNFENYINIYRNGVLYCQSQDSQASNYCLDENDFEVRYEVGELYETVDGNRDYIEDDREGFPYDYFTSNNYVACDLEEEDCFEANSLNLKQIEDGIKRDSETTYYIKNYRRDSSARYIDSSHYIKEEVYVNVDLEEYNNDYSDKFFIWRESLEEYHLYDEGSSLHQGPAEEHGLFILSQSYIKPSSQQYSSMFRNVLVGISQEGNYNATITNIFDGEKQISRLAVGDRDGAFFTQDEGQYIVGEHYIKKDDEYIPVDFVNQVGEKKDPNETYFFAREVDGEIDYVEDDGLYVSMFHYHLEDGELKGVGDQFIGNLRNTNDEYYIKQTINEVEVDKTPPHGYKDNLYTIYDKFDPNDEKHMVEFDLDDEKNLIENEIGNDVAGVVNDDIRVIWPANQRVKRLNFTCEYVGRDEECESVSSQTFSSIELDDQLFYYYDFKHRDHDYETRYYFELVDLAGNVGEEVSFTISIQKPEGRPYYWDNNEEEVYLEDGDSINEDNIEFDFKPYTPVKEGIPYLPNKFYFEKDGEENYNPFCGMEGRTACNKIDDGIVRENIYLRNTTNFNIEESEWTYNEYLNNMEDFYDLDQLEEMGEVLNVVFTIEDGFSGYSSQYNITIDIIPPYINMSDFARERVDGIPGGNLYNGDVSIDILEGETGYLYSNCDYSGDEVIGCDEDPIVLTSGEHIINETGVYKFYVKDDAGNDSRDRFKTESNDEVEPGYNLEGYYLFMVDNEKPTIELDLGDGFVNSPGVFVSLGEINIFASDNILEDRLRIEYRHKPKGSNSFGDPQVYEQRELVLLEEGTYEIKSLDYAGNYSVSETLTIDRENPSIDIFVNEEVIQQEDGEETGTKIETRKLRSGEMITSSNSSFFLEWETHSSSGSIAPIARVLLNGRIYEMGEEIKAEGIHNIDVLDVAGNRSTYQVIVNTSDRICVNGMIVEPKARFFYNSNDITIGDGDYEFDSNDVILFSRRMSTSPLSNACEVDVPSFVGIDENSFIEVGDRASTFNSSDGVVYNLEQNYIDMLEGSGGYVYAFVIEKDTAQFELELPVEQLFIFDDPVGWSIIFISGLMGFGVLIRVFILRRKIKVL